MSRCEDPTVAAWGGATVAAAAIGVLAAAVLYALAGPAASLPNPRREMAGALLATLEAAPFLRAAGVLGSLADVVFAVGCLLLRTDASSKGLATQATDWAIGVVTSLIFLGADSLAGFVLGDGTGLAGELALFAAIRHLFDGLIALGTVAWGVAGVIACLTVLPSDGTWPRIRRRCGVAWSAAAVAAGGVYFAGWNAAEVVGMLLFTQSLLFAWIGYFVMRQALPRFG